MQDGEDVNNHVNWKNTETFFRLQNIFGPKVSLKKLVNVATSLSNIQNLDIPLTRHEKRRGDKVIQWYENNWENIGHFLYDYQEIDENNFFTYEYEYDFDQQDDYYEFF